jgi:quercetin dioxygenase-like cupin family protein
MPKSLSNKMYLNQQNTNQKQYPPMKLIMPLSLFSALFIVMNSYAQDASKKSTPAGSKFTIDNCINRFDMDKTVKTSVGYQYWFIDQNFLEDGQTVKMSVVGPNQATHAAHKHPGDEIFYVLEGTAKFFLDGKTTTGGPNTTFYCPVGSEHGISNAGNTTLKYLVIRKYLKEVK